MDMKHFVHDMTAINVLLLCSFVCVSCDKLMCDDYDFINESNYRIEYTMTKIDDTDTIEAHESYSRHLSQDLGVVITNRVPVYCDETSTSATFHEYKKYIYTITNNYSFIVTLGTSNAFDRDFTVPSIKASGSPSVVALYSKAIQLKDPPGGIATLTTTWNGNNATVTVGQ